MNCIDGDRPSLRMEETGRAITILLCTRRERLLSHYSLTISRDTRLLDQSRERKARRRRYSLHTVSSKTPERYLSNEVEFQAELGTMLGVYLPTIQHILGVTMFIRLFWIVGVAGLGQTCMMLAVCCVCVSQLSFENCCLMKFSE